MPDSNLLNLNARRIKSLWEKLTEPQVTLITATIAGIFTVMSALITFLLSHMPTYVANPSADFKSLIKVGIQAQKSYVLPNVTMHVRMENAPTGRMRKADVRIIYELHALKDITESDRTFPEEYSSGDGKSAQIQRWYGPAKEELNDVQNGSANIYQVFFNVLEGQRTTVITGANFTYPISTESGQFFNGYVAIGPKEGIWEYKNDDDFIGNLEIFIDSNSIDLQRVDFGRLTLNEKSQFSKEDDVIFHAPTNSKKEQRCLYATWKNIFPNQVVGLHYRWN